MDGQSGIRDSTEGISISGGPWRHRHRLNKQLEGWSIINRHESYWWDGIILIFFHSNAFTSSIFSFYLGWVHKFLPLWWRARARARWITRGWRRSSSALSFFPNIIIYFTFFCRSRKNLIQNLIYLSFLTCADIMGNCFSSAQVYDIVYINQ